MTYYRPEIQHPELITLNRAKKEIEEQLRWAFDYGTNSDILSLQERLRKIESEIDYSDK